MSTKGFTECENVGKTWPIPGVHLSGSFA